MKEQNGNENKKKRMNGEKKFYLFTAIGCAAVLIAIIAVALAVSGSGDVQGSRKPSSGNNSSQSSTLPDDSGNGSGNEDSSNNQEDSGNEPVGGLPDGMVLPVATATVGSDYGFYHNKTLNNYYVHTGVDFMAEVGTEVFAVEDGVVESIYKDDILLGTEIVVSHANGVKSTYRFVTEAENLKVGDQVEKGQVIATVAEPTGNEYKDGAHLHFEISENGVKVDPTEYLTLEEK